MINPQVKGTVIIRNPKIMVKCSSPIFKQYSRNFMMKPSLEEVVVGLVTVNRSTDGSR